MRRDGRIDQSGTSIMYMRCLPVTRTADMESKRQIDLLRSLPVPDTTLQSMRGREWQVIETREENENQERVQIICGSLVVSLEG